MRDDQEGHLLRHLVNGNLASFDDWTRSARDLSQDDHARIQKARFALVNINQDPSAITKAAKELYNKPDVLARTIKRG